MNGGRPLGGANGDGSLRPVSIATSAATHPGRSVVIREIRVIRGQPLQAKLDDLPQQMLGARMALLNVLILGNEQSEETTDVPGRRSRNQTNRPGPRMEHGLNTDSQKKPLPFFQGYKTCFPFRV